MFRPTSTTRERTIWVIAKGSCVVCQKSVGNVRSRKPYQVNVLLAGYDVKTDTPTLNWIDYGTQAELPYGAHGYAAFYCSSLLDRHYRKEMKVEEGLELLDACLKELTARMPIDFKGCYVKVVDKNGIRELVRWGIVPNSQKE